MDAVVPWEVIAAVSGVAIVAEGVIEVLIHPHLS
jgi:hypothetical protein